MIFLPPPPVSGSDISSFAFITDVERRSRCPSSAGRWCPTFHHRSVGPAHQSEELIIASAIDAFAHAVDSYLSLLSSPFTKHQALKAMRLDHREPAASHRKPLHRGWRTCPSRPRPQAFLFQRRPRHRHSLAHSLGGRYDVLHGRVHPIVLPAVIVSTLDERGQAGHHRPHRLRSRCVRPSTSPGRHQLVGTLFRRFGGTGRLRDILPDRDCLEIIAKAAVNDARHPDQPQTGQLEALLGVDVRRPGNAVAGASWKTHRHRTWQVGFFQGVAPDHRGLKDANAQSEQRRRESPPFSTASPTS
jgi:alcohol dehydrogenase